MKKAGKRLFAKSGYRTLKAMVIDQCGDKTAEEIWSSARNELNALLEKYRDIPKGEKMHLCGNILPRIAMYRAMLEKMPQEDAVHLLDETIWLNCTEISKKLGTLTSLPGMPSLFLRIFAFMTKKMFGEANGFQRVFHEATGKSLRIDITQCRTSTIQRRAAARRLPTPSATATIIATEICRKSSSSEAKRWEGAAPAAIFA